MFGGHLNNSKRIQINYSKIKKRDSEQTLTTRVAFIIIVKYENFRKKKNDFHIFTKLSLCFNVTEKYIKIKVHKKNTHVSVLFKIRQDFTISRFQESSTGHLLVPTSWQRKKLGPECMESGEANFHCPMWNGSGVQMPDLCFDDACGQQLISADLTPEILP